MDYAFLKNMESFLLRNYFEPAIRLAEGGFAVSPVISEIWEGEFKLHFEQHRDEPAYKAWFDTFAPKGRAPKAGEIFLQSDIGRNIKGIWHIPDVKAFYRGKIADKIVAFSKEFGGNLVKEDLANY